MDTVEILTRRFGLDNPRRTTINRLDNRAALTDGVPGRGVNREMDTVEILTRRFGLDNPRGTTINRLDNRAALTRRRTRSWRQPGNGHR